MQLAAADSSTFRYAVFRYVRDRQTGTAHPIGVALWGDEPGQVLLRFPTEGERVPGIRSLRARQVIATTAARIDSWVEEGNLPYASVELQPDSDAWWRHVAKLMEFGIELSEPLAIDCIKPEEEIEALFEAIVGPELEEEEIAVRVDGAITRALADVADRFETRQAVPGFHGAPVKVRRLYRGPERYVVVDGVNLASPQRAEQDADALTSKLLRLREGAEQSVDFLIGYIASPQGLNGEAAYIEWLEYTLEAPTFDLVREALEFRNAAERATEGSQPRLLELTHDA